MQNKISDKLRHLYDEDWQSFTGWRQILAVLTAYDYCEDIPLLAELFDLPPETIDGIIEANDPPEAWLDYWFSRWMKCVKREGIVQMSRAMTDSNTKYPKSYADALAISDRTLFHFPKPRHPGEDAKVEQFNPDEMYKKIEELDGPGE